MALKTAPFVLLYTLLFGMLLGCGDTDPLLECKEGYDAINEVLDGCGYEQIGEYDGDCSDSEVAVLSCQLMCWEEAHRLNGCGADKLELTDFAIECLGGC